LAAMNPDASCMMAAGFGSTASALSAVAGAEDVYVVMNTP
jgi:hypothetical protein